MQRFVPGRERFIRRSDRRRESAPLPVALLPLAVLAVERSLRAWNSSRQFAARSALGYGPTRSSPLESISSSDSTRLCFRQNQ